MGKHSKPSKFTPQHRAVVAGVACGIALLTTGAVCIDAALDDTKSSSNGTDVAPIQPISEDDLTAITPPPPFDSDDTESTPPPAVNITLDPHQPELEILPAATFMACKAEHQSSCPAVAPNR